MSDEKHITTFKYVFNIEKTGDDILQVVRINKLNIQSQIDESKKLPDWARLDYKRCDNCKLPDTEYCPVAARLVEPIEKFQKYKSQFDCNITVIAQERAYIKDTNIQDGLRSLFGLLMATSGCPSMKELSPMALTHLPFATLEETIYRVVSMQLLKSYLQNKEHNSMPGAMQKLEKIYSDVSDVNIAMTKRLAGFVSTDSALTAVVGLDALRLMVPINMEKTLKNFAQIFIDQQTI